MNKGYRGQTFQKRAEQLTPNDWPSIRDLTIAIGTAIDDLQARIPRDTKDSTDGDSQENPAPSSG